MSRSRGAWAAAIAVAATLALRAVARAPARSPSVFDGAVACHPDGTIRFCGDDPSTRHHLRRRPDRRQRRLAARCPRRARPPLPAVDDVPRLGRLEARHRRRCAAWVERGYAVFSMSDRGWGESCGGTDREPPRARVRGRLHPPDGHPLRGPRRAGVRRPPRRRGRRRGPTRSALPAAPTAAASRWRSPRCATARCSPTARSSAGRAPAATRLSLAAAAPEIPWTDLAYSLLPNGATLDYVADAPYLGRGDRDRGDEAVVRRRPLRAPVPPPATTRPPGTDPDADLTTGTRSSTPASPTTPTRSPPTSSTSSPPTTPRTTSTTRSRPRRC